MAVPAHEPEDQVALALVLDRITLLYIIAAHKRIITPN